MHHVIWVEHDGSWTWSIEEGKAFEDDHKVLARDDGFPTRGDAKEDMQKAWGKLIDQGKRPGKLSDLKKTSVKKKAPANKAAVTTQTPKLTPVPEWAVCNEKGLIALFVRKSDAEQYSKQAKSDSCSVKKVSLGIPI